jgi:hypothetical protein
MGISCGSEKSLIAPEILCYTRHLFKPKTTEASFGDRVPFRLRGFYLSCRLVSTPLGAVLDRTGGP